VLLLERSFSGSTREPERERYRPPLEENIVVVIASRAWCEVCCAYFIDGPRALEMRCVLKGIDGTWYGLLRADGGRMRFRSDLNQARNQHKQNQSVAGYVVLLVSRLNIQTPR
jgi:hypothetical protein